MSWVKMPKIDWTNFDEVRAFCDRLMQERGPEMCVRWHPPTRTYGITFVANFDASGKTRIGSVRVDDNGNPINPN